MSRISYYLTMKKIFKSIFIISFLLISCENSKKEESSTKEDSTEIKKEEIATTISDTIPKNKTSDFIPKGFKLLEEIKGDLNKDGIDDCILLIKEINKENIVQHEFRGELDRNRRGIIVLLNENGNYKQFLKNIDCFSSENEEGGVYYAPELSVEIKKGNLYIHYAHGRYGYWSYTFRLKNSDFELIGYDSSDNNGAVINSELSINFLSRKKIIRTNTNENADSGEEVFEERIVYIEKTKSLGKLSEIKDFDDLELFQ
ncbi:hypothetical protein FLTE109939_01355 [Flavobacterium terrigena]|uniref:Lipoprotein n=2 Tax=Flavobacterium terrigena TaxID=402734 RepID=A0A1H6QHG2_9FLAO|nr:hypothetical protein SAMN05660918_0247 [Flavobacterium terrigena]